MSAESDYVLFDISGSVATITLNRPEVANALCEEMLSPWLQALETCRINPEIRAIVITGAGSAFCGGGDVNRLGRHSQPTPLEIKRHFWESFYRIPKKLAEIDKPVVAAINGKAVGAGADVALQCDLRFASHSANFQINYADFGLVPGNGATYFLPRIVGEAKALELLWCGELITSEEALNLGLVNQVFADEELMDFTYRIAHRLAEKPQLPLQMIKRAVKQSAKTDLNTHLDLISSHMVITRLSQDHGEAVDAYLADRDPCFKQC